MAKKRRNVIAIDAGYTNLGYVVAELPKKADQLPKLVTAGISSTKPSDLKPVVLDHVRRIERQVELLLHLHESFKPVGYFVELPHSGAKSAAAGRGMAISLTYITTTLYILRKGIVRIYVTPYDVKRVAGSARASKDDVVAVVLDKWPDHNWPGLKYNTNGVVASKHDATDAAGTLLAAMDTDKWLSLFK